MAKVDKKIIKSMGDLFDIPDTSDTFSVDNTNEVIEDVEEFSDVIDGFTKKIAEVSNKGVTLALAEPEKVLKEPKTSNKDPEEKVTIKDDFSNIFEDNFDSIEETDVKSDDNMKLAKTDDNLFLSNAFSSTTSTDKPVVKDGETKVVIPDKNAKDQNFQLHQHVALSWNFTSPSALYNSFYYSKRELIEKMIGPDVLNFHVLNNELEQAHVDISSETFDPQEAAQKMTQVQQYRSRICALFIKINKQFFILERQVSIFEGKLARIHYEKPSVKNLAVQQEHMNDMFMYFDKLVGIRDSARHVMQNLDGAYECLSRRISVSLQKND